MPATPRDLLDRFQQAMLDFSADALADLFADEAIYEFVFWTPHRGPSQRYDGREEIRVGFRAAWGSVSKPPLTGFGEVCVHETADPEVIISEGEMDGVNHATGRRSPPDSCSSCAPATAVSSTCATTRTCCGPRRGSGV
ncbi:nuclear transport factor 2 family protein [Microbispora rosea]|uniref:nuclear transport factor 2 family protein n=1 Tax=Microbispora rosea TaxID=58117 RepID=UPI0037955B52